MILVFLLILFLLVPLLLFLLLLSRITSSAYYNSNLNSENDNILDILGGGITHSLRFPLHSSNKEKISRMEFDVEWPKTLIILYGKGVQHLYEKDHTCYCGLGREQHVKIIIIIIGICIVLIYCVIFIIQGV